MPDQAADASTPRWTSLLWTSEAFTAPSTAMPTKGKTKSAPGSPLSNAMTAEESKTGLLTGLFIDLSLGIQAPLFDKFVRQQPPGPDQFIQ